MATSHVRYARAIYRTVADIGAGRPGATKALKATKLKHDKELMTAESTLPALFM